MTLHAPVLLQTSPHVTSEASILSEERDSLDLIVIVVNKVLNTGEPCSSSDGLGDRTVLAKRPTLAMTTPQYF